MGGVIPPLPNTPSWHGAQLQSAATIYVSILAVGLAAYGK
jgi:hypothetical protein